MSDNGGNKPGGFFGTLTAAMGRLTPEFIALVFLFFGLIWLFDRQNTARERVLAPLIEQCSQSVPMEVLKYMDKGVPAP